MTNDQNKINQLLERLDALVKKQDEFTSEINQLKHELDDLQGSEKKSSPQEPKIVTEDNYSHQEPIPVKEKSPLPQKIKSKSDFERFIGENLISKIGIIIIIIGVAIGGKYAIDNQLISPLTRIILGYLVGGVLLGFAIKLKEKYENFSAVLISGAMAIMYFITYLAYSLYDLLPQTMTFGLMVVFTAFTVLAAINYNKQIIALIGLVGAYAVPFLLSDGSGSVWILFSYIAIINTGVLVIAFKKYWKNLFYSAFGLTWLIYVSWFASRYQSSNHFALAIISAFVFFALFYFTFLAYKVFQKEKLKLNDIILPLANSFIFFCIGYSTLYNHETGSQLLGLFTLFNAVIHFVVSVIIYRQNLADRNLFYLISGLVLVFVTIAIPVQLEGSWVTLLWVGEAALLFWIGRTKNVSVYEKLSYPLMFLAFFSIIQDWMDFYFTYFAEPETRITPIFNITFLSSLLFIAAFGFINFINHTKRFPASPDKKKGITKVVAFAIPTILLAVTYFAFRLEIGNYWFQLFEDSKVSIDSEKLGSYYEMNQDLNWFKSIWIINYSLFFFTSLTFINIVKIKDRILGLVCLGLTTLSLIIFLTDGLYILSELRESYLLPLSEYYRITVFHIVIRYISFAFVVCALIAIYRQISTLHLDKDFRIAFDSLLHLTVLWIASSELINWMDIGNISQSYKLGLSILWGIYALFLIAYGIWKAKKYLRIGAIALFGVTLIKLFFYDISHLDTIAKTIVFLSLGILLLIVSFLYNKYKHTISNESDQ